MAAPAGARPSGAGLVPHFARCSSAMSLNAATNWRSSSGNPPPRLALVRGVPDTFPSCITMEKPKSRIVLELAKQQHSQYVDVLQGLVDQVVQLPADNDYPDCPFIEDTAVVIGSRALLTRPGAVSRRGEVAAVKSALQDLGFEIFQVEPPGTLDGGDVLYADGTLLVGKSSRTNAEGIEALSRAFPSTPVVPIDVAETLHLKSVLSWLGPSTYLAEGTNHAKQMFKRVQDRAAATTAKPPDCIYAPHAGAANILWVGDTIIYPSAYPSDTLLPVYRKFARQVLPVDISEFHKGDGGLTCLSIIVA